MVICNWKICVGARSGRVDVSILVKEALVLTVIYIVAWKVACKLIDK